MKNDKSICIHGYMNDENVVIPGKEVNPPFYPVSAYNYLDKGIIYPRYLNTPNQQYIINQISRLERAESGLVFCSGMGAIRAIFMTFCPPNSHIVSTSPLYGGTHQLLSQVLSSLNISYTFVKEPNIKLFEESIRPNTKLLYIETPSNPLLNIFDIEKLASIAKKYHIISAIDNTFATPINQKPHLLNVDIVAHSGTKYLGGHSDMCFGALTCSKELCSKIYQQAVLMGSSLNPWDCFLIYRSLKTLFVRIKNHNSNAMKVAQFLDQHPKISRVYYPGLPHHTLHHIAKKQMEGFGGMLSFELKNDKIESTQTFITNLHFIAPAISLGGVESTICVPAQTSHAKIERQQRYEANIKDGLIRLSVGIEDPNDIIQDIDQSLSKVG